MITSARVDPASRSGDYSTMLRTLFVALVLSIATIVLGSIAVLAHLLGIDREQGRVQQWCMRSWARSVCTAAGVTIVVHGAEHASYDRGAVYATNHVSWFDVFALAAILPRYTFIAKAELRRIPIFGWGAEGAGVVFLPRENRRSAFETYQQVSTRVRKGMSVVVCPEGTRGTDYHLRPFKKGPFVLAIAAGAPVVPIVIHGTREIMAKGSFRVQPGVVQLHLLEPVPTTSYDYDQRHELMHVVWQRMADTMRDLYSVHTAEQPVAVADALPAA